MLSGAELASIAKHTPERLEALADEVRYCGRRLESYETADVLSIVRVVDEDGVVVFRVVLTTDQPDCWYWQ